MKQNWNPETRPRPTSALYEVEQLLQVVRRNQALPIDRRAREELEGDAWLCLSTMLAGHGNEESWGVIVKNLNVAIILTELGYGPEWAHRIREAMRGTWRAKLRHDRTGSWGLDGPAAVAIREALEVHAVQLEHAPKADVLEALRQMYESLAAGNVYTEVDTV